MKPSRASVDGLDPDLSRSSLPVTTPWYQRLFLFGFVALAVYVLYYPALSGPFLLDDLENIRSASLHNLGVSELLRVAASNDSGLLGRPLPVLTLALNQYYSGLDTTGFKMVNLVLHLFNGFLLFQLLQHLLVAGSVSHNPGSGNAADNSRLVWFAGGVSVIWLIHPLQISGVMYIVQRMNLMSTAFALLSLLVYVQLRLTRVSGYAEFCGKLALVVALVVLAVLSKENGALIPLYLFCVEAIVFRFKAQPGIPQKQVFVGLYGLGAVLMGFFLIYLLTHIEIFIGGYARTEFTMVERLLTQPLVVWNYLGQILLPRISDMSLYHDDFPIESTLTGSILLAVCGLLLLLSGVVLLARRIPLAALGIALFFASHLLESTVFPLELMFEHRNYFGLSGVILCLGALLEYGLRHRSGILLRVGMLATIVLLGSQSWLRAGEWSSELMHNAIAAQNKPDSRRAQIAYSNTLARSGQLDEAIAILDRAQENGVDPNYVALARINLKSYSGQLQEEDVRHAADQFRLHPFTLDHAQVLLTIERNVREGSIQSPSDSELLLLFAAIQESPVIRLNARGKATLGRYLASYLVAADRWNDAVEVISAAIQLNRSDQKAQQLKMRIDSALSRAEVDQ